MVKDKDKQKLIEQNDFNDALCQSNLIMLDGCKLNIPSKSAV